MVKQYRQAISQFAGRILHLAAQSPVRSALRTFRRSKQKIRMTLTLIATIGLGPEVLLELDFTRNGASSATWFLT
jgi:hypothetical protein